MVGITSAHVCPDTLDDIASFVQQASSKGTAIVPAPMRPAPAAFTGSSVAFIDLKSQNKVLEHSKEDQVISVQAGMRLAELEQILGKHRQWWPVTSRDKDLTIGDLINYGQGGCLEHQFGGPRELVLGLTVILASGDVIRCGGKVVKNVTGYD